MRHHPIRILMLIVPMVVAIVSGIVTGQADPTAAEPPEDFEPYLQQIPGTGASFEMVPIPGGTFTMGSPKGENGREADEGPQFRVKVQPFWMGRYEVMWGKYRHFMEAYKVAVERIEAGREVPPAGHADAVSLPTPPYPEEGLYPGMHFYALAGFDEDRPAVNMTQFAAKQFTKWLSKKTGRFYRLPTEAEWEYAARAGTQTAYSFGDDAGELREHAWYAGNAGGTTQPVGRKKPNPWNLYDMPGNAAEWCIDQYVADWYEHAIWANDWRHVICWPRTEYPRVVRGGSFYHFADELRSAHRIASSKEWKSLDPEFPTSIWWHTTP